MDGKDWSLVRENKLVRGGARLPGDWLELSVYKTCCVLFITALKVIVSYVRHHSISPLIRPIVQNKKYVYTFCFLRLLLYINNFIDDSNEILPSV